MLALIDACRLLDIGNDNGVDLIGRTESTPFTKSVVSTSQNTRITNNGAAEEMATRKTRCDALIARSRLAFGE
jgi:hypothetical protein